MKKTLLFGLAFTAGAGSLMAATFTEPKIYEDFYFKAISADGRIAVSETYGTLAIFDLQSDADPIIFQEDWEQQLTFSLGLGNAITADGSIILGSTKENTNAAYYENGVWTDLSVPSPEQINLSNGITPDGSRICGTTGLNEISLDEDNIMQIPAYWDRNADGSGYGECHQLPYPEKDFFGEVPQYITAISISADGKTIVGQVTSGNGRMQVPIIYTEDENGEWSYTLPTESLFNPDKIEPVEKPGEYPKSPSAEDFMTEEEITAYNDAMAAYIEDWENNDYPEYENFMTDEEWEEYQAAMAVYEEEYAKWDEELEVYFEYLNQLIESSPNFLFNNILLSPDGKSIISTLEAEDPNSDPMSWFESKLYTPCSIDIATGELTKVDTEISCLMSGVADNGIILAGSSMMGMSMDRVGYVIKDGEVQTITEYLAAISPEYKTWIDENLTYEVVVGYDEETWDEYYEEMTFTGALVATPDMSVIISSNDAPWDALVGQSVIFDLTGDSSVKTVNVANEIYVSANGIVNVPAGYASLEVYNLGGACVKSVANPNGEIALGVPAGAYVVKATRADGSASVVKVAVN